ncbi:MAG: hypothetical protein DCF23_07150 [Cyanobium sp.]|nr:MAG: hypothetical protein DCF23_07150 [Cyanobium sp.]
MLLAADTAGVELELLHSRLLITKDSENRSIWPVHLTGWQALGWQVVNPTPPAAPEPIEPEPTEPEPREPSEPHPELEEPLLASEPAEPQEPEPQAPEPAAGEALLAEEAPNFQAMTKAEIVAFCSGTYGVSLDGGMTKAELVEEATALQAGAVADGTPLLELPADLF